MSEVPSSPWPSVDRLLGTLYDMTLWVKAATVFAFVDIYCVFKFKTPFSSISWEWLSNSLNLADIVVIFFGLWTILAFIAPLVQAVLEYLVLMLPFNLRTYEAPSDSFISADALRALAAENDNCVQYSIYQEHARSLASAHTSAGQNFALAMFMLLDRYLGDASHPTLLWQLWTWAENPDAPWLQRGVSGSIALLAVLLVCTGIYRGVINPPRRHWIYLPRPRPVRAPEVPSRSL